MELKKLPNELSRKPICSIPWSHWCTSDNLKCGWSNLPVLALCMGRAWEWGTLHNCHTPPPPKKAKTNKQTNKKKHLVTAISQSGYCNFRAHWTSEYIPGYILWREFTHVTTMHASPAHTIPTSFIEKQQRDKCLLDNVHVHHFLWSVHVLAIVWSNHHPPFSGHTIPKWFENMTSEGQK